MLVAILVLYFHNGAVTGKYTFDLLQLYNLQVARDVQVWLFLAFGLAFAIKVPMFPFHTWLPDAHTEAPTAGSMLLAGVLLKLGAYGFLRVVLGIFPDMAQQYALLIAVLAFLGVILGSLAAMAQKDFKRLVAYSSVNHMAFVVLGIATIAIANAPL